MTIYSAVLIGCQRVTEGQTDVQPIAITCFSIADARNNDDDDDEYNNNRCLIVITIIIYAFIYKIPYIKRTK